MRNDIKNKETQERTKYVPASVEVIEFASQNVVCTSSDWPDIDSDPEETLF